MEGQLRLGQPKLGRELTDTALATAQGLNHLDADRIGQGLEQLAGLASRQGQGMRGGGDGHGSEPGRQIKVN